MRHAILAAVLSVLPALAAAQQPDWVQVEAVPGLAQAQERARAYARSLPDVNGFALGGRWYGVTLGPYAPDVARATLARLRASGAIPRDSYVSDGAAHGDRFWPLGLPPPAPAAPAAPAAVVAPSDETPEQARAAEAALDREERAAVQAALAWLGHYDAAIDGAFGAGTRAAMASWQASVGATPTGVLTSAERARLAAEVAAAQAALGLAPLAVPDWGIALTAPLGLVAFDRVEAPFVHFAPRDGSGVRLSLVSQAGDAAALAGLYEVLQSLEIVPEAGERALEADGFRITGAAPDRTTEVRARLVEGHVLGFLASWPEAQDAAMARALPEMERTLASTGAPLPPDAGLAGAAQDIDAVSGLAVRRPLREASGFWVDAAGAAVTAAAAVEGCGRVTLDGRFAAEAEVLGDGAALLRPEAALAPPGVARLAVAEPRLRGAVAVGGFPYGGTLTAATLTAGTVADVRGLEGEPDMLRLAAATLPGEAGGPVLDARGDVAGMLLPAAPAGGRTLPAGVAFALRADRLSALLRDAGVEAAAAGADAGAAVAPEELAARAAAVTVLVGCWE